MAAPDLGLGLALDHPLNWVVTERVLAEWYDSEVDKYQYLGTLSANNHHANFTLAIGLAADTLLIAFHLTIKLRPSTSSKAKSMVLVIPVEVLDSKDGGDTLMSEITNVSSIPERTLSETRRAGLVESTGPQRMIKVQFRLKNPGYVIMPQASVGRSLKGTPLELLQSLRSLSQALSFDAYMKFNTYAQVGFHQAKQMLSLSTSTPAIDVKSMYNGLGAMDAWDQYLLGENKGRTNETAAARQHNPFPPPYPDAPPKTLAQLLPPMSSPTSTHSIKDITQLLPSTPIVQVPRSDTSLSPLNLSLGHENPANLGNPLTLSNPLIQGNPVSLNNSRSLTNSTSRERTVISETPLVQPSRKRRAVDIPAAEDTIASESLGCTTNKLTDGLAQWLEWAWSWLPEAHEHLQEQIFALGRAARDINDHDFALILAECTSKLMFMAVDKKYGAHATATSHEATTKAGLRYNRDLEADLKGAILYINAIQSAAYVRLEQELFHMAEATRGHGYRTFEQRKAVCISKACVLLQAQ